MIFQAQTKIILFKTRTPASIFLLSHYFSTFHCKEQGLRQLMPPICFCYAARWLFTGRWFC